MVEIHLPRLPRRFTRQGRQEIQHERIEAAGPSIRRATQRVLDVEDGRKPRPEGWDQMSLHQRQVTVDPEYGEDYNRFLRSLSNIVGFK